MSFLLVVAVSVAPLPVSAQAAPIAAWTSVNSTPLDFAGVHLENIEAVPYQVGAFRLDPSRASSGALTSPEIASPFPFRELVLSWNAEAPKGASLEFRVRVKVSDRWSPWYSMGLWEEDAPKSLGRQEGAFGRVDIDTLVLANPAEAYRYEVQFSARKGSKPPVLRLLAVSLLDSLRPRPARRETERLWSGSLSLSPRSQMTEQPKYRHDICSPTSLAMVLDHFGRDLPTPKVAEGVRDREAGIYGNWPLNVAFAAGRGLAGHVAYLSTLGQLEFQLLRGRPVIVSIAFEKGELEGAPITRTRGHLLVVSGISPEGDVIVHDPAAPDKRSVRRTYPRNQFERAWLGRKNGVAYVLHPRFQRDMIVGVPTADLLDKPSADADLPPLDENRLTQLVYGEEVRVLKAKGDWLFVEALEQSVFRQSKRWHGYRGWVRAGALLSEDVPWPVPNAVVSVPVAEAFLQNGAGRTEKLRLPLGAKLHATASGAVLLPDGRLARIEARALQRVLGLKEASRPRILAAAGLLLGRRYVWGGRSILQREKDWGTDCSGLVNLAYRTQGMDVPRDAEDQHRKAVRIRRSELEPADLVFLTKPGDPKRITHVMLFAGGDALLESHLRSGLTRRTTFREKFGKPLKDIESGDWVEDLSQGSPARRRIYFGTFF